MSRRRSWHRPMKAVPSPLSLAAAKARREREKAQTR